MPKYFIGWRILKQPRFNDTLTVKVNNISKSEIPANIVYHSFNRVYYTAGITIDTPIIIKENDRVEYLLNDKPIPEWVEPLLIINNLMVKL